MLIRVLLAIALAGLIGLPAPVDAQPTETSLPLTQAPSTVITVVASGTASPGSFKALRVLCPAGMVAVGGGVDPGNVLTMTVTSSAPVFAQNNARLIFQPDGENPAPIGWQASVRNNSTTTKILKMAVICAPLTGVRTVVGSDTVQVGGVGVERVLCPQDMTALSGGIDLENVLTMKVTSSAPAFGVENADRLIFQPDGTNPRPVGWQATARNDDAVSKSFKIAVICAPLAGVRTVVASKTVQAGSFSGERVLCPQGMTAIGGGIDLENVLTMKVTSSAPAFGVENADRLIFQPDGTNPRPVGWQATARNDAAVPKTLKVAVICQRPGADTFLPWVIK